MKFLVHASYIEVHIRFFIHMFTWQIYNEDVRDLLVPNAAAKLEIKEHPDKGVYVGGLSMHAVHNAKECEAIMQKGFRCVRHTRALIGVHTVIVIRAPH
jgi:hypothetical protein